MHSPCGSHSSYNDSLKKKFSYRCSVCGDEFEWYPWELHTCDSCVTEGEESKED